MENGTLKDIMCIFACLLNSRRKENVLLATKQRKNILQDFLMSIFREILKLNLVSVESSISLISLLINIARMKIIVGLLFVRYLIFMDIKLIGINQKHLKKY